jgi:hypothetical protein
MILTKLCGAPGCLILVFAHECTADAEGQEVGVVTGAAQSLGRDRKALVEWLRVGAEGQGDNEDKSTLEKFAGIFSSSYAMDKGYFSLLPHTTYPTSIE